MSDSNILTTYSWAASLTTSQNYYLFLLHHLQTLLQPSTDELCNDMLFPQTRQMSIERTSLQNSNWQTLPTLHKGIFMNLVFFLPFK